VGYLGKGEDKRDWCKNEEIIDKSRTISGRKTLAVANQNKDQGMT
jgi:hypothetical protein